MATFASILLTSGSAYFFYKVIFPRDFFPFINILAFGLLAGVGVDDAFILLKVRWIIGMSMTMVVGGDDDESMMMMVMVMMTTTTTTFMDHLITIPSDHHSASSSIVILFTTNPSQ